MQQNRHRAAASGVASEGRTFSFSFGLGGGPSRDLVADTLAPMVAALSTDTVSVFPTAIVLQLARAGAQAFRQQLVVLGKDGRPLRLSATCDLPFLTLSPPRDADAGRYTIDVGIAATTLTPGTFEGTITTDEASCSTLQVSVSAKIE